MGMRLALDSWELSTKEGESKPKLRGKYVIMMGDKRIAGETFNGMYDDKEMPFSNQLMADIDVLNARITEELQTTLLG
jgi:hypothetical protein